MVGGASRCPPKRRQKLQQEQKGQPAVAAPLEGAAEGAVASREEVLLQQEYSRLCKELEDMKGARVQLREENEFLQQEAQRLRAESQEFMCYVAKRAQRRQDAIISLNDQNKQALEEIRREQQELLTLYQRKEAALREQLLHKEGELLRLSKEVEGLREIQALQQEQAAHIRELQEELVATRQQHTQHLQETKSHFLHEKAAFEQTSQQQGLCLLQQAQEEVVARCMQEHSHQVKCENQELRQELHQLIQRSRTLHLHKRRLEEQAQQLLRERCYMQDMARLYHTHQGKK
ncbi:LOW QUALITY PROTEIN: coiled-coil domain-containing protein 166 [Chrysemys picta bellii]|uniref:LOW QUALITY PROTEIN: coiled-coil domain-containing protein 166 n=1 Tax=Chrysemys picta bellii TaxID=8478 RepID=UPI0032B209A9